MGDRLDTACYRELGAELRKRREAAGLTTVELARKLGWSVTRVSRSELGHLRLSVVDVITYLAFCGVYGNYGAELHAMCREAEPKPGHWLRRHEDGLPESAASLIYHETTASLSVGYEPEFVPGLLQTEGYIRSLTAERWPHRDVEFAVEIRMDRQRILHRPDPGQSHSSCTRTHSGCGSDTRRSCTNNC
jgi:transcriptional regulator with XRE-family HTH domain